MVLISVSMDCYWSESLVYDPLFYFLATTWMHLVILYLYLQTYTYFCRQTRRISQPLLMHLYVTYKTYNTQVKFWESMRLSLVWILAFILMEGRLLSRVAIYWMASWYHRALGAIQEMPTGRAVVISRRRREGLLVWAIKQGCRWKESFNASRTKSWNLKP